jgi:hypothetical protein
VQCFDTRTMKSLLLQRVIIDTFLRLVALDSFVLDAEWVLHTFQMQCDGKSLACEKQVCHWGKLPSVLVITTLPSVVLLTYIDWPMTLRIARDQKGPVLHPEDNALGPLVRRNPFANSTVLKRQWLPHRLLSARTVRNRLKYVGYRSRRHIKRCLLTQVHKVFRLQWRQTRHQWNLASWRKVHWSDERRFLLHVTNGRVRVWRQPNTAYAERNIVETVTFGGGSVMVWGMSKRQPQWTNLSAKHPWSRCCASLWQSSSEYKVCLYWWQRQTPQSSCCDILLAWRVDNHTSMACQESWLKPDRAHLGHYRSSSERKNTDGSNFKWLGANTAPGMAGSYPSPNSSFSGQYEKTIIGSHPC